jgi:hypothetical protein
VALTVARLGRELADLKSLVLARFSQLVTRLTAHEALNHPLGQLDYAQITANQGSITAETTVTGLTFTQALLTGRLYRFTAYMHGSATVTTFVTLRIKDDGVTVLESVMNNVSGVNSVMWLSGLLPGPIASSTWTVTVTPGAGTLTVGATSTRIGFLLLEDIGPA